jgi:HNH endonuclease/Homing endonuclease associated repeat
MPFELETFHRNLSEIELIADMQRVATELGKQSITRAEQNKFGSIHSATIVRRLGGWPIALEKAGLENERIHLDVAKEDLFRNLEEVWTKLGRQPRDEETHAPLSRYHAATYKRRFGGWQKALKAFVAYINEGAASESDLLAGAQELPKEMSERGPRNPGRRLIMQVLIRDKGICQLCRRAATADGFDYHIDHIMPWIKGGPTVLSNLQLLCSKCNLLKGDLDLTEIAEA